MKLTTRKYDAFCQVCSGISFAFILVYMLDILLLGGGKMTKFAGISTRIVWFGLAGLSSLPLLLKNIPSLIRNRYLQLIVVFMTWLVICAARGLAAGHSGSIIKSDIFGYLNLLLLPTLICVLNTKKRRDILAVILVATCAVMVFAAIYLSFYTFFPLEKKIAVYKFTQDALLCILFPMTAGTSRVLFHTATRYFLVAYMIALYYAVTTGRKAVKALCWSVMGLFILGIVISYSRALYAGSGIAVLLLLAALFLKQDGTWKRATASVLISGVVAVAMLLTLGAVQKTNIIRVAVERTLLSMSYTPTVTDPTTDTPTSTEDPTVTEDPTATEPPTTKPGYIHNVQAEQESLDYRETKLRLLRESIAKNPVFGNGIGTAIDFDDGYVEYIYHDIINKMGVFGLALYVAPFLLQLWNALFGKKRETEARKHGAYIRLAAVAVITYFWFITYFNPCMNTTVGIFCYLLTIVFMDGTLPSQTERVEKLT